MWGPGLQREYQTGSRGPAWPGLGLLRRSLPPLCSLRHSKAPVLHKMKLTLLSITTLVAAVSVAAAPTLPSSSSAPLMPADDPFYQPPSGWWVK